MTDLDAMPWFPEDTAPVIETPRKCRRHVWFIDFSSMNLLTESGLPVVRCKRCNRVRDADRARRGKTSRNYGNRAELAVARKYGGEKVGHAGGPVDVRGAEFNVQVKTHRRPPPREWTVAFAKMAANRERIPRLLLRFVMPGGVPPDDYFVFRGSDWLSWFGRDGDGAS